MSVAHTAHSLFAADSPRILKFAAAPPPLERLTLREAFERYKLPELGGRSPDTIGEYRTHLARWEQFWSAENRRREGSPTGWEYRTHCPVLPSIGRNELLLWRNWLLDLDGNLSPRTVNKHLGSVHAIMSATVVALAGAAERIELPDPPRLPALPAKVAARKLCLTHEQVDRLMQACAVSTWPANLHTAAPTYWRAAIVLWCNYGLRTQELVRYHGRMTSLLWSDIHWQPETPHPDGQAVNEWGWLTYTPEKQSGIKSEPLVLPLNETTHRWPKAIRPSRDGRDEVFPWPLVSKLFYATWKQICSAAGIAPKKDFDGSQAEYQIKHLRKTCTTWHNDNVPGIAQYITGHAADRSPDQQLLGTRRSEVSARHYDSAENRILAAVLSLRQPTSFAEVDGTSRQLLLFG